MKLEEFQPGVILRIFKEREDGTGDLVLIDTVEDLNIKLRPLEIARLFRTLPTKLIEKNGTDHYLPDGSWEVRLVPRDRALSEIQRQISYVQSVLTDLRKNKAIYSRQMDFFTLEVLPSLDTHPDPDAKTP